MNKYKNDLFVEISENMNIIAIEKFIKLLQENSQRYKKLENALNILDYLHEYNKIISQNISFSSQFTEIIEKLNLTFRYYTLLKRKKSLSNDLKLSQYYKNSENKTALVDLLNKLNKSLIENTKKLKYLEEDYLQRKNQISEIRTEIEDLDLKIQTLTNQKKHCFNQINKITRAMTEDTLETKKQSNNFKNVNGKNLTNAEQIKNFQRKAREIQYEINTIKSKNTQIQSKFENLNPIFQSYKNDYEKVLEIIKKEEKRIKELQTDLKNKNGEKEAVIIKNFKSIDLTSLKPLKIIQDDLEKVDTQLEQIVIPKLFYDPQNVDDLSKIIIRLKELDESISKNESEIIIEEDETKIIKSIDQFIKLENTINDIETWINIFLSEINLKTDFTLFLDENNKHFFIEIIFIRNDKNHINFDVLTTPEKIFFLIIFYISIMLYNKSKNIIFSNVSVLSKYNKAGSIYRTIRKILPIFENDDNLLGYNLIFIITNLELKEEIKNLKVKTLHTS